METLDNAGSAERAKSAKRPCHAVRLTPKHGGHAKGESRLDRSIDLRDDPGSFWRNASQEKSPVDGNPREGVAVAVVVAVADVDAQGAEVLASTSAPGPSASESEERHTICM